MNPPVIDIEHEQESSMLNPAQIVDGMKRHFWIPLTLSFLGIVLGYSYYKRQRPVFEATSVGQFGGEQGSILGIDSMTGQTLRDEKAINTLIQAAKSRDVMGRIVAELDLSNRNSFAGPHPTGSKEAREAAVAALGSMIKVSLRKETRLIDFTVAGEDPELVTSLANQAVLSLVSELENQKTKTLQGAVQSLVAEGQRLQEKLKKSEIAMHDYKRQNEAISLDERKDLVLTKLKELGADLNRQSKERLMLETHLQACESGDLPRDQLLNLPTIANHPKVSGILSQIGAQKATLAVLAERYKAKHPKYQSAQAVIENLEKQLDVLLTDAVGLLKSSFANASELEKKQEAQLKQQESEVLDLEALAVQYNVLKREMESDQAVYESVLTRIKQVDVSKGMETPPLWVHQLAMTPSAPVSPDAKKTVSSSAAGGFMMGLAIIGLMVMRDRSIRTVDDARMKLRLPVFGMVSSLRSPAHASGAGEHATPMESILSSHRQVAECMREFRTIITRKTRNEKSCFLITSAVPEEGKTFVSTHLAVSLATQDLRTLLIDMDMRRCTLAGEFGLPDDCKGLSDLLLGTATLGETCFATGIQNLSIMPAGHRINNPAEMLATCGLAKLKEMVFAAGFDRIVIDTAPLIPVSDTLVLGELADELFVVVRCNRTPSVITQEAIRKLHQAGLPVSGLVLNRLTQRARGYDYYFYNSYYRTEQTDVVPLDPPVTPTGGRAVMEAAPFIKS